NPNGPVLPGFQGLIARALVETPQGRARYLAKVAELMKTVYRPEALLKRLDELQAQVRPVLAAGDPGAARRYPQQVNRLRQAIRQGAKSIAEQLKQMKK